MATKKRFMRIKDIIPLCFPLLPMGKNEEETHKSEIEKSVATVLEHTNEKLSICKNLLKAFKFLHNKFSKRMRMVIDLSGENVAYTHEYS